MIKALEDFEFEGTGYESGTLYRAADHQCFHDVFVVEGKTPDERASEYDLLKLVKKVTREEVTYPEDLPAFGGPDADLGPYEPA